MSSYGLVKCVFFNKQIGGKEHKGRGFDIISASVGAISMAIIYLVEKCKKVSGKMSSSGIK